MKYLALLIFIPLLGCSGNSAGKTNENTEDQSLTDKSELTQEISDNLPEGWTKGGDEPQSYEMGIDNSISNTGKSAAYIESKKEKIFNGFGTMMQTCLVGEYLGKRIKLTGYVKAENVDDWAGMWLRVDAKNGNDILGFDNMQERPIKGTADWTKCEIVLDVPEESGTLN